jgi:PRTRC genetic system protein E
VFSQLAPLLAHRAVLITISKLEGDQLQVNVCPRQLKTGENQALTTPLYVTGTAAELDAEFAWQISAFVESHVGLNTNLTAIEKEIAEAEKAAREDAKKRQKTLHWSGTERSRRWVQNSTSVWRWFGQVYSIRTSGKLGKHSDADRRGPEWRIWDRGG